MKTGYDRLEDLTLAQAKKCCFDKHRYENKNEARDKAAKIRREAGRELTPYKCLICKKYHLTSLTAEEGHWAWRKMRS